MYALLQSYTYMASHVYMVQSVIYMANGFCSWRIQSRFHLWSSMRKGVKFLAKNDLPASSNQARQEAPASHSWLQTTASPSHARPQMIKLAYSKRVKESTVTSRSLLRCNNTYSVWQEDCSKGHGEALERGDAITVWQLSLEVLANGMDREERGACYIKHVDGVWTVGESMLRILISGALGFDVAWRGRRNLWKLKS